MNKPTLETRVIQATEAALKAKHFGRNLQEEALNAAVTAAVRHRHTEYNSLLAAGLERTHARDRVADEVRSILQKWKNPG
jgi:hypothetical protein